MDQRGQEATGNEDVDWEALLRAEGMPSELGVKRMRATSSFKRVKGSDPQPRREVSYAEWEDGLRSVLLPDTDMEAMLQPGEQTSVEAEMNKATRIFDAVDGLGPDHGEVLDLMTQGLGPQAIAETLGIRMTDARSMINEIRGLVRTLYSVPDGDPFD